jgi:hypothetical protein
LDVTEGCVTEKDYHYVVRELKITLVLVKEREKLLRIRKRLLNNN